jgi:glycosyltransferase involved in cell wall biosynthesis
MAKICMVAFTQYLMDNRVRREAEALVDRGDEVDVICFGKDGEKKVETINGVSLFRISVMRYKGTSAVRYLASYALFFIAAFLKISFLHLRKRYDVIQVHTMPDFMVFVAVIPKILGAKVILDVHDLMPELFMSKFGEGRIKWMISLVTYVEKRSIAFAHKAIAVSKPHLNALLEHGNPEVKFITLLNVPDPKIFGPGQKAEPVSNNRFRLIYHGTVSERYGLDVAIRAVSLARKEIPRLEFQIVGDGDDRQRIAAMINELKLSDCVEISKKYVPIDLIPSIIEQANVGIVPILNDQFTRCTLPVKVLEYVLLEKPVIASRIEGLEFYFNDSMVLYFRPGDEVELANRILEVYRNPQKVEQLVSNANRFNKEFNWDTQKKIYYGLIDSLVCD